MDRPWIGERPAGWGADDLSSFLDDALQNQLATFATLSGSYRRLADIDAVFQCLAENLDNPPDWIAAFFVYRAHAAYRAAVRLALSGQVAEAYPLIRTCLENAVYGLHFNRNPLSFDAWRSRNESEQALKRVKSEFQVKKVMVTLAGADTKLHSVAEILYDRTIDLGAHPNQLAVFSNLDMVETPEAIHFDTQYLVGDSEQLRLVLKSCAQVGVTGLGILRLVFKERFDILGLTDRLEPIKKGL